MSYLVVDTETTGFTSSDKIVQLAMQLYNDDNQIVGEFNSLINHDFLVINNQEFHDKVGNGISVENCKKYGVDLVSALYTYIDWAKDVDIIVGHNLDFDLRMIASAFESESLTKPNKPTYCTMKHSKQLVKSPPTARMVACGRTGYKNPKLEETYKFLFGEEIQNAHDAMGDVRSTARIYLELKGRGL